MKKIKSFFLFFFFVAVMALEIQPVLANWDTKGANVDSDNSSTYCSYEEKNVGWEKNRTLFVLENNDLKGKAKSVWIQYGTERITMAQSMNVHSSRLGNSSTDYIDWESAYDGRTNKTSESDEEDKEDNKYFCPIFYVYKDDIYWGTLPSSSNQWVEFIPTARGGAKACAGSKEDHEAIDDTISNHTNDIQEVKTLNNNILKMYNTNTKKLASSFDYDSMNTLLDNYNKKVPTLNNINSALGTVVGGKSLDLKCGTVTSNLNTKVERLRDDVNNATIDDKLLEEIKLAVQAWGKANNQSTIDLETKLAIAGALGNNATVDLGALGSMTIPTTEIVYSCEDLIDEDLKDVIQFALGIVRIIVPILLILLCAIDFGQAVISQDPEALKKAGSKVIKRVIAAIAIFLIPYFVDVLLEMPGVSGATGGNCENIIKAGETQ